jgi:hypothetical protein
MDAGAIEYFVRAVEEGAKVRDSFGLVLVLGERYRTETSLGIIRDTASRRCGCTEIIF